MLWILLLACAPSELPDVEPPLPVVDNTPLCPGFGQPCDALPPRPEVQPCGVGLDLSAPDAVVWPEHLSELHCFDSLQPLVPAEGLVFYEVNSPLWTEGAFKERFFSIPAGATITPSAQLAWEMPLGALLLKAFSVYLVDEHGPALRPAEVRVMAQTERGWAYASYGWEEPLGDLTLRPRTGQFRQLVVQHDGLPTDHAWYYPGVEGCRACHRDLADEVLGPHTNQLRRVVDYGGVRADQLVAMDAIGLFDPSPAALGDLPALPDPLVSDAPIEDRARSWLHANCAHCHQPGGFVPPELELDLRYDTPLADTAACRVRRASGLFTGGDYVIDPGHPENSALMQRLTTTSPEKMPPDGATWADEQGIALVNLWILGMAACP